MAKAITSEKISLKNVRLSFPVLDKPRGFKKDDGTETEPAFSATFLLDPSDKDHAIAIAKIKSEAARIAKEFFTDGVPKAFAQPGTNLVCFGKGNDLEKVYEGYEDMFYVKVKSSSRIPIVGRAGGKQPVAPGDAQWPYAGCYVNAPITLWTQNSHGRKAINGNLIAIQFVKDGAAFGGGGKVDPEAEFEALEDGAGEALFGE